MREFAADVAGGVLATTDIHARGSEVSVTHGTVSIRFISFCVVSFWFGSFPSPPTLPVAC
jgi:hypothetical protein